MGKRRRGGGSRRPPPEERIYVVFGPHEGIVRGWENARALSSGISLASTLEVPSYEEGQAVLERHRAAGAGARALREAANRRFAEHVAKCLKNVATGVDDSVDKKL